MSKALYSYLDYRDFLADRLKQLKAQHPQRHAAWFAEQIGIQKPYVSKVLKKDAHLSSDQLFLAARVLNLADAEGEYIALIFEFQRSGLAARKKVLRAQIQALQAKAFAKPTAVKVEERIASADEKQMGYYLDPVCLIVHMFLTIPSFQNAPAELAAPLKLSPHRLNEILERLRQAGVIEKYGANGYRATDTRFHLERTSPLYRAHQRLLKLLCLEQQQGLPLDDQYGFMTTFSTDLSTVPEIHAEFQRFLKRVQALNEDAGAEQVMQMNFDLFRWG